MAFAAYWEFCQAQKKGQAPGQVSTPAAPGVVPVENGCPAPTADVKIEDAVVPKSVPKTSEVPPVAPTPLGDDAALEALSAGLTNAAPSAPPEDHAPIPLDALEALSESLGAPEPEPEPPKLDPSEIVNEGTVPDEEAVLVGERDDTLPPEYRLPTDGMDLPPPVEDQEPSMDPGAALDALSGDFMSTPGTVPAAVPKQSCLDALNMLDGDFSAPALAEEGQTDIPTTQTLIDGTPAVISCDFGTSAALPTDIPADLRDEAPAISDLPGGNMLQAQS